MRSLASARDPPVSDLVFSSQTIETAGQVIATEVHVWLEEFLAEDYRGQSHKEVARRVLAGLEEAGFQVVKLERVEHGQARYPTPDEPVFVIVSDSGV